MCSDQSNGDSAVAAKQRALEAGETTYILRQVRFTYIHVHNLSTVSGVSSTNLRRVDGNGGRR